ncbi:MAG: histidine phosphatase family protein [Pirellulaceae bacterium]
MTKQLLLMRHAKSDWPAEIRSDHDRPLNGRGRKTATRMGRWIQEQDLLPDLVLCSSARRTQETVERMLETWSTQPPVFPTAAIYLAAASNILNVVRSDGMESNRLLLVGHNPGMADLVGNLCGESNGFPTAALAIVEFAIDSWADLLPGSEANCRGIVRPKSLFNEDEVDKDGASR